VRLLPAATLLLCLARGAEAPPTWAGEPVRPLDNVGLEAGEARIEWKEDWPATYEANKKRWTEELRQGVKDRRLGDRFLSFRLVHLLEELAKRFPGERVRRVAALGEAADRLAEAGCRDRANHYLKRLVEEFPGAAEPAVAALHRLLTATLDRRGEVERGDEWVAYAVERLAALHAAGLLADSHPSAELAWKTALALAMEEGRLWDATRALERLEAVTGRNAWWRTQEAELLLAAGRRDEALRLLDDLAAEGADGRVTQLLHELSRERVSEGPEFARRWALEARWEATRSEPEASVVHGLLPEAAKSDALAPAARGTQASLWAVVDRELRALPPAAQARLRDLQKREAAARFPTSDLRSPLSIGNRQSAIGNEEALFALWRRYPWAPQAHDALMAFGEAALRRGRAGLALRGFEDVLAHSADAGTRSKAQAGVALALRQEAGDVGIRNPQSAIRNLAPPAPLWPTAAGLPAPPAQVVAEGGRVFLAGPCLLACYGDDLARPLWWRVPEADDAAAVGPERRARRWTTVPGPFAPAAAGGRVVTRWGLDPSRQFMADVAAFEAATGELAWSTRGQAWWEGLAPVTDPAVAEGRVYFLAVRATPTSVVPVWLVCLDAAEGTLLWQRFLTSCSLGLPRGPGAPHLPAELDLVHFGNAPRVHRGAVYCTTNLGFVARCDARDGLVEWVRTYPRACVGRDLGALARRQGATPLCCEARKLETRRDVVVFAPRDYTGAFALNAATGALVWDAPFVPSQRAVGLAGDALVFADDGHLAGIETSTGRLLWDRRAEKGFSAILAGNEVWLQVGDALCRIAADTGQAIERTKWTVKEPVRGLALRGESLVILTGRLSPAPPIRNPQPAIHNALGLPLQRAWSLPRPEPTLWVPPAEAKPDGRLYLLSQDVLECVSTAEAARPWRRAVPGGVREIGWVTDTGKTPVPPGTMLLFCPRRVQAVDGLTGGLRWEAQLPFEAREWSVCGDHLFVARPKQGRDAAFLRLATGVVVWHRTFADLAGRGQFTLDAFAWDGQQVHLFASRFHSRREGAVEFLVRPSDGWVSGTRPFPSEAEPWPLQLAVAGSTICLVTQDKALCEYSLADGSLRRLPVELTHLDPKRIQRLAADQEWIHLYWDRGYDAEPDKHWLVPRRGGAVVRRKAWGEPRGDRLFEAPDGAGTLTVFDLRAGKETLYRLPALPELGSTGNILAHHEAGERVLTVATAQVGARQAVRVDSFSRADGAPLNAHLLANVEARNNQVAWAGDALFVTDPSGLHCFVAGSPSEPKARPVQVAYRLPAPLPPGGSLLASGGRDVVRLTDPRDTRGSLSVAHDEECLHVAVRYHDPAATPWGGGAAGDWLELGLKTNLGAYRWALGLDRAGKLRCRGLGGTAVPPGLRAMLRHDPAAQQYACELSLPWKGMGTQSVANVSQEDWRRVGLWAVAWDDRPAEGAVAPAFAWGREPSESGGAGWLHDTLYLDARTREQGDAITTVVEELPDLPVSLEQFRDDAKMRSASRDELFERYWAFIERHPQGPSAEQLLLEMAVSGRQTAELERAARLGVPEAVRKRVAWQLGACLSQWVYCGPGRDFRSVLLEFNSGMGFDEWGHRAYWGKPIANWIVPPTEMGPLTEIPENKWHELRVPLFRVNLHDKPICGINFCQQGATRIVWDRTALVAGGKETVFVEDDTPKGTTRGEWEWVAEPRHSGARAHTHGPLPAHYDVRSHTLSELEAPIVAHLAPPLDRPYISQWVWLDPAAPPTALALSLHDGRGWAFRAVWGRRVLRGRAMGPMPPPGQWHELRLPLAWTPFLPRAIAGVAFSHVGGRVVWDRTALVVGGKEHVLIDDEPPPLRKERKEGQIPFTAAEKVSVPCSWQSWVDGFEGGTRPVPGKVGLAMACDGHTGYIRAPHSPDLDPQQLTVEAWVYLDSFALGSDTKQWVLNKNGHAWEDGYFGLVIYRDKAVANLNIGGQKENRFEAWSEEGTLKLKTWHHLVMTYDSAALKLYRDAALVAETPVNKERKPGRGSLYIARWAFGRNYFAGLLDEVRLYRRALSAAEIAVRHGNPTTLEPAAAEAVAAHWGFDAEAAPADPLSEWQWVEQPARSGKRAHTNRVSHLHLAHGGHVPNEDVTPAAAGHAAYLLKEPLVTHLPFDRARAAATLQAQIPRLGPGDEAWRLFTDLLQFESPNPQRRVELNVWFLTAFPGHPRAADVLGNLLDACTEAGDADPTERVLSLTKDLRLPIHVLYHYHRKHALTPREFLRSWQLIGPFPGQGEGWGLDTAHPPEADAVRPDRAYTGLAGEVRWRPVTAEGSYVNLKALLGPAENAVAYAAAWVHSDRERPAVLAVGSDDRCKVWLNRKLLLTGQTATYASAGEFIAPVTLNAGWNELLLKVTQGTGEWGFYFELLDQFARRAPLGVRVASAPPEAK